MLSTTSSFNFSRRIPEPYLTVPQGVLLKCFVIICLEYVEQIQNRRINKHTEGEDKTLICSVCFKI